MNNPSVEASEGATMKMKMLRLLSSLTLAASLPSCVGYEGAHGYGASYRSYDGGYNSRPLVSYSSFNSYSSRPSYGSSGRSSCSPSIAPSFGALGFNRGSSNHPLPHSSRGPSPAPVSIQSQHRSLSPSVGSHGGSHSSPGIFSGGLRGRSSGGHSGSAPGGGRHGMH